MTWFKVDDGFAFHPKAIMAGNAALGLWVRAGAWCGANLTDGALPRHMIGTFGAQARDAKKLVAVGLWVETETGYQFHEWNEMQPSKAEVERERAANRKRQQEWRDRKRNATTDDVTHTVTNRGANGSPTRPDPTTKEEAKASSPRKRGTRIPDDFTVSPEMREWFTANCPNVDGRLETEKFINYWQAKSGRDATKIDWPATWRNWMLNAQERAPRAGKPTTTDRTAKVQALKRNNGPERLELRHGA